MTAVLSRDDGLRGEERPGVMRGRVGVIKGNAVEVDVVIAVGEAAEVGLGLAEAYAITGGGEGVGRHVDDFAVVGDGRTEVLDEGRGNDGARRGGIEQSVHGRKRSGDGANGVRLDGHLLGDIPELSTER
jgi:hypothetical protein